MGVIQRGFEPVIATKFMLFVLKIIIVQSTFMNQASLIIENLQCIYKYFLKLRSFGKQMLSHCLQITSFFFPYIKNLNKLMSSIKKLKVIHFFFLCFSYWSFCNRWDAFQHRSSCYCWSWWTGMLLFFSEIYVTSGLCF